MNSKKQGRSITQPSTASSNKTIHLLITDVVMPQMHGRQLAEQLRVIRPNLKCLYMSGYTADVIEHRGILDEGLNFIQKPFSSDDLAYRIRQVLDQLG
ncbi:MAG: response regulator [Syntrophobacteraceae bacterium]